MKNIKPTESKRYMMRALELAACGRGRTSPNPMVGAVLVRKGRVVGEGCHLRAGGDHAEIAAIRAAGSRARGADLYVSLEPCCHHGRTPPCTDAIREAGIARVFAAMRDPNPMVSGKGGRRLRRYGIPVTYGIASGEAARLNEAYCKYIRTRTPFVCLKTAQSLDGKIATRSGDSRWITGKAARAMVHEMRNAFDAIMVGVGTVVADNPRLTTRLPGGGGRDAVRVVVDPLLRTPEGSRILAGLRRHKTWFFTTSRAPSERRADFARRGAEVFVLPSRGRRIDMRRIMAKLGESEVTSVMIEGGGETAASALEAGVVDKVVCFIAPLIIGGRGAPLSVAGRGPALLKEALRLRDCTCTAAGDDFLVEGYPTGGRE